MTAPRRDDIEAAYPLSPVQQGMLFHTLYAPGTPVYMVQRTCRILGDVDVPAFRRAWQRVVDRHPALRTAFLWEGLKEPLQVVGRRVAVRLEPQDWRGFPPAEQARRVDEFLAADLASPFRLSRAPLMRLALFRLGDRTHQFVWTHHHLVLDGWSTPLLFQDLFLHYQAFAERRDLELPSPRPYHDYIAWLKRQNAAEAESYWRRTLKGFTAPTPLVVNRRAHAPGDRPGIERKKEWQESAALTVQLLAFARRHQLTLNTLMQGAWALLLSRYSGEETAVFGATVSGRPVDLPGAESMLGMFINTLPVRVAVRPDDSLVAWLKEIQEAQVAMRQYEYSSLLDVQAWSEVPRGRPLFDSIYVFENYPTDLTRGELPAGLGLEDFRLATPTGVPLSFWVCPGSPLSLQLCYDSDLFEDAAIDRMAGHLDSFLEQVVARPDLRLRDVRLLTAVERREAVHAWNDTRAEFPRERRIHELIEAQVERTPDAPAVLCGGAAVTYRQLDDRARALAARLEALGVGPETRVGISLERSLAMVVGVLGILKAGGAYVPLDPAYPSERLAFMLADSQAPVLVTERRFRARFAGYGGQVLELDGRIAPDAQAARAEAARAAGKALVAAGAETLAYVMYTSGSTGTPKGVQVAHASVVNLLEGLRRELAVTDRDVLVAVTSLSFDIAGLELFLPLIAGGRLVVAEREAAVDGARLGELLEQSGATVMQATPATWQVLLAAGWAGRPPLRILCGGEALPPELAARLCERGTGLWNLYGPTETTIWSAVWRVAAGEGPVRIGRPIANTQIYVLDDQLEPAPVGVPGELHIGGEGLARGYGNRPELTAEKFIPDPFGEVPGARLYRTGDLARYRADGELEFLGRLDHQVKVHGFRIELGEIESAMARHPAVRQALAVVREDRPGDPRLVGYVVSDTRGASPGPPADPATGADGGRDDDLASALRRLVKEQLPEHMVPSAFVRLEALPLQPNGKVDRRALPAPEDARAGLEAPFVLPRTPVEEELARMWSAVLGVERISIFDDFFELGGHSLLAMQLVSRARAVFRVELPLRDLFEARTIAGFAAAIERAGRSSLTPPIPRAPREGDLPLSYAQEGLWFLDQLAPGTAFYNMPAAVRLTGPLDVGALARAFGEIVRRHEALRTTFPAVAGRPAQVIAPTLHIEVPVVDLSGLGARDRDESSRRLAAEEAQRPFDLACGPLLRARLLRLAPADHVLLVTVHHIVADGWSMGILVRELAAVYEAFSAGEPSPLAELPLQYADYADWQRRWLQGTVLEEHLAYWKKQLAALPVLDLPTDRPRPAIKTFRGALHTFELPAALARAMDGLARREGVTLFTVGLAAFKAFLARYTGQEDIVVGAPVANRTRTEVEGLIGLFMNTLVLRTSLAGNPSGRDLLARVRETALHAFAHQDLPFEKLVEALQPDRDRSRAPLFEVLFVLGHAPASSPAPPGRLTVAVMDAPTETAKFDLTLFLTESGEGLVGAFEYSTDLFDAETIRRMAENFCAFLDALVRAPERRVSELGLLGPVERDRLLVDWNDTRTDPPREACVHRLIEEQVERTPDRVALVAETGALSYRELNRRSNQLAHRLRRLGVGPDTLVGVCMKRSPEMVMAVLGVLKAGGAYVPLDPAYPAERLAGMLEDARVPLLLTQERLLPGLPQGLARSVTVDAGGTGLADEAGDNPDAPVTAAHRVYAIFTSGSTGRPKLAGVYHRGFGNLMRWFIREFGIGPEDRTLLVSSFNFDLTQKNLFAPLMTGGRLHLSDPDVFDPEKIRASIDADGITLVNCTPSAFYPLVDQADERVCRQLRSLRHVFLGGEPIAVARLRGWMASPECHAEVSNTYGPTECTDICAYYRIAEPGRFLGAPVPIGRPIPNVKLYVLDGGLGVLPIGALGELCVAGAGVGEGYLNDAELSARKFVPNPFAERPGERLYRTGDLVRYLPSGDIEYLGRIDQQVKIRGFRIEPGEIEAALARHPAVAEAAVVAREEAPGDRWLVAYVVPRGDEARAADAAPLDAELRRYLKAHLPDYMVPAAFVALSALPLTPNGKLDRRALPVPERGQRRAGPAFVAPTTPQEAVLADILAELLGVDKVGIHDNFFELGGDSILAIQMIARANRVGVRLSPGQLFQYQTIAELAAVAGTPVDIEAEQGIVEGPVPLTPVQQSFFARTPIDPHHFNHAFLLEVRRPLDAAILEAAVAHLLGHHDALRMRFEHGEAGWQQYSAGLADSPVASVFLRVDLAGVPPAEQKRCIEARSAELQASLDLGRGPLMRVAYFDLGPGSAPRLLLIVHHLVIDGVSWRVLLDDLVTAYQQLARGGAAVLPAKTTSFQQWARRLPAYARTEALRAELGHWRSARHARITRLPVDIEGGVNTAASLDTVFSSLGVEETRALLQDVPAAFRTQVTDALLTALVAAVAAWTGERSLLIELEGHGRENLFDDVDISRTVGWFTSLYPVFLELADAAHPVEALRSVRQQLDRIPNRGMGYGILRYLGEDADIRRELQAHPAPEVTFNYHGQVDQTFAGDTPIVTARESAGPTQSPRQRRPQLVDVIAGVTDGALKVAWTYATTLHARATIERVARGFTDQLRALIAASQDAGARAYTPADFPLAKLSQAQLDKVLRRVSKGKADPRG